MFYIWIWTVIRVNSNAIQFCIRKLFTFFYFAILFAEIRFLLCRYVNSQKILFLYFLHKHSNNIFANSASSFWDTIIKIIGSYMAYVSCDLWRFQFCAHNPLLVSVNQIKCYVNFTVKIVNKSADIQSIVFANNKSFNYCSKQ